MALVSVPSASGSTFQNVLPISRTFIKYYGHYTYFWHFPWRNYFLQTSENQSNTEIPRKRSIKKITTPFFSLSLKKPIISKKSERCKEQRNRKCQQPQYLRSRRSENAEKEVQKTDIHNLETAEDSDTKCCGCCENSLQTTKEDDRIECASCRNWLHEFCSPYKHRYFDCGRWSVWKKNSRKEKTRRKFRSLRLGLLSSFSCHYMLVTHFLF